MDIKRIDHIGVVVDDLTTAKAFFVDFGFSVQGEAEEQSELLDKVVGMQAPSRRSFSCRHRTIR